MPSLSDDENSDSNIEFKVNNEYAKNYNSWRQKEELHKLKQRYGDEACKLENLSDESTSESSDDDDEIEVSEKFDEDFLKVLALLKSDNPKNHDENLSFFNDTKEKNEEGEEKKVKKSKKEKAVTLRDFERKIILERGGKYSDSEDESKPKNQLENGRTYVQEQNEIKNSFKAALEDSDEEEDLLVVKDKSEQARNVETRKEWLKGQNVEIDPKDEVLKPIREFWANPNLDVGEKLLRDFVLDNKHLDANSAGFDLDYEHTVHDSDENLSEDEHNIERQEEFEHKYNFRFEEPDQEFIKKYPRTIKDSMRKKDTRRSEKRADLRKRKEEEKLRKKEELKELKALKRKEIEEKLEKLKEVTGNDDIGINMADLEGDFDPNEYDKKMQNMFNDDFYTMPEDDVKPQFLEIDEEINADFNHFQENCEGEYYEEADCEDPNFIMDADYDPSKDIKQNRPDSSKKKKKGRNKNVELPKEKPKFDPEVYSSYQNYIDHHYALDYEDMIGDIPCRFKLRKSVPNDYGLSVEEILFTDDKELNKWCSLKKALEFKPEEIETREKLKFQQKAKNDALKRKILKSFYSPEEEDEDQEATTSTEQPKKKRRKKKKGKSLENEQLNSEETSVSKKQNISETVENVPSKSQKRKLIDTTPEKTEVNNEHKKKLKDPNVSNDLENMVDQQVEVSKKKKKKGNQNESTVDVKVTVNELESKIVVNNEKSQKKKKKKRKNQTTDSLNNSVQNVNEKEQKEENENLTDEHKKKKSHENVTSNEVKAETITNEENKETSKSEKYQKLMKKKENRKKKLEKKQKYLKLKNKLRNENVKDKSSDLLTSQSDDRLKAFGKNPKKFKNLLKYGKKNFSS